MTTDILENEGLEGAFTAMRSDDDFAAPATIVNADPFTGSYVTAQQCSVRRNEAAILAKMKALANAKGADYYYSWEVKNKNGTKGIIEGGTIKLADDLSSYYMNCIVDVRAVDCGDHWMIYARFADLENGTAKVRPYRQRKSQNVGKGFQKSGDAERALDMMMQIGASKAARNVVMHSLRNMWDELVSVAKGAIVERIGKNPEGAKTAIIDLLAKQKVEPRRAELFIGRKAAEWTVPDMAKLWSTLNSIKDGFINADDAFPSIEPEEKPKDESKDELDKLEKNAKKGSKKKETEQPKKEETPPADAPKTKAPAASVDPDTGEIKEEKQELPGFLIKPPHINIDDYDFKSIEGVLQAGEDLKATLEQIPEKERRIKSFELSWGEQVIAKLQEMKQTALIAVIRGLLA